MSEGYRAECLLLMRWTAPTAGIAMYHIAIAVEGRRESAFDAVDGAPTGI